MSVPSESDNRPRNQILEPLSPDDIRYPEIRKIFEAYTLFSRVPQLRQTNEGTEFGRTKIDSDNLNIFEIVGTEVPVLVVRDITREANQTVLSTRQFRNSDIIAALRDRNIVGDLQDIVLDRERIRYRGWQDGEKNQWVGYELEHVGPEDSRNAHGLPDYFVLFVHAVGFTGTEAVGRPIGALAVTREG